MEDDVCRFAIIDDHPLIAIGVKQLVRDWQMGELVLSAESVDDYVARSTCIDAVDFVIVDREMPGKDGFDALEWIRANQPRVKSIMISFDFSPADVKRARALGARAVLRKVEGLLKLRHVLDSIRRTGEYMDEYTHEMLSKAEKEADRGRERVLASLSPRELELLEHLNDPDTPTYGVIAERMAVKYTTIQSMRRRLFEKFGIKNKVGLYKFIAQWRVFRDKGHPKSV